MSSLILDLIEALYQSHVLLPDEPEFYGQAIEDIEFFSLSPTIHHLLIQSGRLDRTPTSFQRRLKQESSKALYQNFMIRTQTGRILDRLDECEIPVIPLKGITFTEKYYGHLGARWTSDIDLLIHPSNLPLAMQVVKSLGFTQENESAHFHASLSKELPNSPAPLTVELHWNLLREKSSALNIEAFWQQAIPCPHYHYVKELSDYHTFYMICLHGWRHQLNSLKYFVDIMQMIHVLNEELDYTRLWEDARCDQNLKRVYKTLAIVYNLFPHLHGLRKLPGNRKIKIWWEYQAIRDSSHKTYRQYLNLMQFKYLDFDTYQQCLHAVANWFLPSSVDLLFELGSVGQGNPYVQLYKKRSLQFMRLLSR